MASGCGKCLRLIYLSLFCSSVIIKRNEFVSLFRTVPGKTCGAVLVLATLHSVLISHAQTRGQRADWAVVSAIHSGRGSAGVRFCGLFVVRSIFAATLLGTSATPGSGIRMGRGWPSISQYCVCETERSGGWRSQGMKNMSTRNRFPGRCAPALRLKAL
jgi:hypothetical protein